METKVLNYFVSSELDEKDLKGIEINPLELKALTLKDVKDLNDKNSSKEMNISSKEFEGLLKSARKKITEALINGTSIIVKDEKEIRPEDIITTLCTFRCATCGSIYTINYEKEDIICPICFSTKVMTSEEAGFIKNQYKFINKNRK
ncbi:DUF134 domain-containing protein [Clostridium sp. CCUG 7971]|uniref:DUF134 domain-containing protein n=1 Tax=Clostridium sp. CCUG 7971 TaxID=2811414 RepID=UPI001ABA13BD|nr:DUF134 domain-containing protein [Clostridium sp. CCUG 7971]MBO3443059.1 DUF134 domain-containing protein [Clostridium sp. CCUG 7971]